MYVETLGAVKGAERFSRIKLNMTRQIDPFVEDEQPPPAKDKPGWGNALLLGGAALVGVVLIGGALKR